MRAPAGSGSISEVPASLGRPRRAWGSGGERGRGRAAGRQSLGGSRLYEGPSRPSPPLTPPLIAERLGGLDAASEAVARPWPAPVPSAHPFSSSSRSGSINRNKRQVERAAGQRGPLGEILGTGSHFWPPPPFFFSPDWLLGGNVWTSSHHRGVSHPSSQNAERHHSGAMLFHGISGGHIQGIMEEMERRSKSEARLAKGAQLNGRDAGMPPLSPEKPALCAGCGGKIADRYYLLAVDKQWHLRCLKCCECKLALESELTCFAKDGSIYCKEDYYRRFSVQRCARCHLGISASEMVMRARDSVYHLSCFTCSTCNKTLTTGDHFGMKDSLVYCRAHFETLLQGEYPPQLSYTELAAKSGGLALPYFNGTGTVQKGRPRKRKSPALGVDIVNYNSGCNENEADHLDRDQQPYPPSQKTKRMRTSFKHHQLRTMKSYFAINHNPDAKDLKQLAQKTGLTKRVLQGEQILGHYSQTSRRLKIP